MITRINFYKQCITYSQMNMISNSRLFWRRFTTWIRVYIISRYVGIGTEEEAFSRLYFETLGIGNLVQIIFERENANLISQQFNQFTFVLRDLITAQFQENPEAMNQNVDRLYKSAADFASLLTSINPYINETEWQTMLEAYVQDTIEEANSFITGNYSNDIQLFRRLTKLTNRMGDSFAQALNDYITSGYDLSPQSDVQCITYEQMNQIYDIRMFLFELVIWTRAYMLSRYRGIGDADEVKARLDQVPVEYVNVLQQFFGRNLEPYLQQLNTYIRFIDNLITAQIEGNVDEVNRITQLLYQNADQRASFLASLNPYWDENEWRTRLYNHLHNTINESTTFLTGDDTRNLDIFRTLLDQAENASGFIAQGLFNYLIN